MSIRTATLAASAVVAALSLGLAQADDEMDIVGDFDSFDAFVVKTKGASVQVDEVSGVDEFAFANDHTVVSTFFIPGTGAWSFDDDAQRWNVDFRVAAETIFEASSGLPTTVTKMAMKDIEYIQAAIRGDLKGKWSVKVGGHRVTAKLRGGFVAFED